VRQQGYQSTKEVCFKFSKHFWKTADCKSYLLTPWNRVLLKKLISSWLVEKFPAFYGTRRFITAVTRACHLSLYSADCKSAVSKCLPIPGNGLQYPTQTRLRWYKTGVPGC